MKILLTNDFHGTGIEVELPNLAKFDVPRRRVDGWRSKLCGSDDCACSGMDGQRPAGRAIEVSDNLDGTCSVHVREVTR